MASEGATVLSYHDTCLRKSDVNLLDERQWLNDNVICFWFDYLEHDLYSDVSPKIVFFSPQVVQLIKSSANSQMREDVNPMLRSMDLKEKELVLIPVNDCNTDQMGGTHWSLLLFAAGKRSFEHYDSHTGSINRYHAETIVDVLTPHLITEREADSKFAFAEKECTQQDNSYDCGIHLICNAEAICRKYFRGDARHISDISSPKAIRTARRDLLNLILSIQKKFSDCNLNKT